MVFWRRKKDASAQDRQDQELLHPQGVPELEPSTDDETDLSLQELHNIEVAPEDHIIDISLTPAPEPEPLADQLQKEEFSDHSDEGGWFSRLTAGLSKSSSKIGQGITDLLTKRRLDQDTLDELEEVLIAADLGPSTAAKVIRDFAEDRFGKDISEQELKEALAASIAAILEPVAKPLFVTAPANGGPFVILVAGVNGVGKTTTIGKLAQHLHMKERKSVLLAAGDTFRAAAVEQLQIWAERTHTGFFGKDLGADAAAVAYEAYDKAKDKTDVLMIDTAGRLHNKANLMAELEKIVRVLKKQDDTVPHEVLLVLDATTGQNAIAQVETFKEMVNITGLIVTKLDGSARGGIVVTLADQFRLPIYAVGVGETAEDLQPFHPHEFAKVLVGLN